MRVALAIIVAGSALLLAGCGSEGTVSPTAAAVEGTVPHQQTTSAALPKGDPAAGKRLFTSLGCSGCHTYGPAGSSGTIGPDLDKLPQYAQKANQGTLEQFTQMSITDPGAYVESGYQNLMPTTFASLPKQQLADLVAFLTQKS
ncbi:MAG: c-type cytochrome [Gaiellaceae bacterium]